MRGQKEQVTYTLNHERVMYLLGVILSVMAGLVFQAALYIALDINVADVPLLIMIILWTVFSIFTAFFLGLIEV